MDKKPKKDKKDFEAWLLGFEKQINKPCVVSLLIEEGGIEFLACWDKKRYLDLDNEPDEGEPSIDFEKAKKEVKSLHLDYKTYIG